MMCQICNGMVDACQRTRHQIRRTPMICQRCEHSWIQIQGTTCPDCGRPSERRCADCIVWEKRTQFRLKHQAIYTYNFGMQNYFRRYKFYGAYELRRVFRTVLKRRLRQIDYDILVPVPINNATREVRGFNQVLGLIEGCRNVQLLLADQDDRQVHQVKKGRVERLQRTRAFIYAPAAVVSTTQKICLVDDVYTTGATMHLAYQCLRQAGFTDICSISLAR